MSGEIEVFEYYLNPGYIFVYQQPTAIYTVLGSCVAVSLYDRQLKFGGMNHFLYPFTKKPAERTSKYGNVALKVLLTLMLEQGGRQENLVAQIFGGAHRNESEDQNVGLENVSVVKGILDKEGIPIGSQDVGGHMGRKVVYSTTTNEAVVYKVDNIRAGDWYPYVSKR